MTIVLVIALILSILYGAWKQILCIALSAYTHKKGIPPGDDDLKECCVYAIGRLFGQKPRL